MSKHGSLGEQPGDFAGYCSPISPDSITMILAITRRGSVTMFLCTAFGKAPFFKDTTAFRVRSVY